MALKKEDFTEEQWAEIQVEADRRASTASETARKNAERAAAADTDTKIADALERERAKFEADEAGKLEIQRKEIADAQKALAIDRKGLVTAKKLAAAGLSDDAIESLLPMFVNVDDKMLGTTLDSFVMLHQNSVKTEVDAAKQILLGNATAPANSQSAPVGNAAAAAAAIKSGDEAMAIELLMNPTGA
jgi:hypothetical protein